jgi:hypothetical protein
MRLVRSILAGLVVGLVFLACSGNGATEPEPRVIATLQCVGPNQQLFQCNLQLSSTGGFEVELVSTACEAHGNTLRLLQPTVQTLTNDGCYEQPGRTWTFAGPFPPGTAVAMEVESAKLEHPPVLRVTGAYPQWTIEFEDGFDDDFNDLILAVRATP